MKINWKWLALASAIAIAVPFESVRSADNGSLTETNRFELIAIASQLVSKKEFSYDARPWTRGDSEKLFDLYITAVKNSSAQQHGYSEELSAYRNSLSSPDQQNKDLSKVYDIYAGEVGHGRNLSEADKDTAAYLFANSIVMVYNPANCIWRPNTRTCRDRTQNLPQPPPIEGLVNGIAVIRPLGITVDDLTATPMTDDMIKQIISAQKLKARAILLDFRFYAGGRLGDLADVMGLFVNAKPGFQSKDFKGLVQAEQPRTHTAWRKPVALLINENTATGAEMMAAGLRDRIGAPLIGVRTSGKTTIREGAQIFGTDATGKKTLPLGGIAFSRAVAYRIDGSPINKVGLEPDIWLGSPSPPLVDAGKLDTIPPLKGFGAIRQEVALPITAGAGPCPPATAQDDQCLTNALQAFERALGES